MSLTNPVRVRVRFRFGSDYSTTLHDTVRIKHSVCHSNGTDVVVDMFEVWCAKGFWFGFYLGDFRFGITVCTYQFMRPLFLFFSKLSKLFV